MGGGQGYPDNEIEMGKCQDSVSLNHPHIYPPSLIHIEIC